MLVFEMGNGYTWSVSGRNVVSDEITDIDFTVKENQGAIPENLRNSIVEGRYSVSLQLSHNGEFGFTATMSTNLDKKNAGLNARLYYYNENSGQLELICTSKIAEDGTVNLIFSHASDYIIVVGEVIDDNDDNDPDNDETESAEVVNISPKTGEDDMMTSPNSINSIWIVAGFILVMIITAVGFGVYRVRQKMDD